MLIAASLVLKALAMPLLARIGWVDFTTQKIANRDVLLLLCVALGSLQLLSLHLGSWWNMGLSALAGLFLFVVLLPFWVLRKIGAGDVKLMAVMPLLIGSGDLTVFSVLLLVFAIAVAVIVKNPFLLPEGVFRFYVEHLDRKRVVPFGVVISMASICTIAFQIYAILTPRPGPAI